jgi:hypothetical protein
MLLGHSDPRMTQKCAKLAPEAVADETAAEYAIRMEDGVVQRASFEAANSAG